jgi:hypothetical protein
MTEEQKECMKEIEELMLAMKAVVKKYDLENQFISVMAAGFLDLDSSYVDEDGSHRADMSLLTSFSVTNEDELEDMLSYCMDMYSMDIEEEPEQGTIEWWMKHFGNQGDLN